MSATAFPSTIIAGASSGIGKALAIALAPAGNHLILIGQDKGRLAEVAHLVRQKGGHATTKSCDLSDLEKAQAYLDELSASDSEIAEVYFCIGRNIFGDFAHLSLEDLEWIYRTNFLTMAHWVTHFYPRMVARGHGRLVLFSSVSAFTGLPLGAPYAGAKSAFLGLEKSLIPESRHTGVDLHFVYAGFVATRFFEASHFRNCHLPGIRAAIEKLGFPMMTPDQTAELTLKGIRKGKSRIVIPLYGRLLAFLGSRSKRIFKPIHYRWLRLVDESHRDLKTPEKDA